VGALRFEIIPNVPPVSGHPRYVRDEHAFAFGVDPAEIETRKGTAGATSFVVDTLQLEVAVARSLCLYTWGYCPMRRWSRHVLSPPRAQPGALRAIHETPLVPGVSIGLEEMIPTTAWFDPASGWFCIGHSEPPPSARAVEFATGSLAILLGDGRLSSLWVKPENWQEIAGVFSGIR
jgi:hypothetical protein